MAFDQSTRNRLQHFVNGARRVLEEEFTRQLQNDYGMDPNSGAVTDLASLRHINDAQRESARILRDTLAHYCASGDMDARQGLDRIVREQAFTVLNRLAALRMAEARGLLIESVANGFQAKGFQLYARLAGTGLGETGDAYRIYLFSVFDELSQDLPGLFDRFSPQGRLFPREAALLQVLNSVNDADVAPLWREDETIGWIYQYFNSKEERAAMRDASQAPRNSRELAVRNQFFTPRYVVEFLVDNTLGSLWFKATGGATVLRDRCQHLLVKHDVKPRAASKLRDPRTVKLLDPACGSMHFGLYAFDLFVEIYLEAWVWEQQQGPGSLDVSKQSNSTLMPLSQTYSDQVAYSRDIPRLIIEHNIYGVDIDPRAAQIASLALWLRAQRAWHTEGVKAKDRPLVGRGNVVAATAPPAERELQKQFASKLDKRDAELFEKTLMLLKGLPELGVLLQVERELPHLIRQVYVGKGTGLFAHEEEEGWQQAEKRLRTALSQFAHAANSTYQSRLFAMDALQGLRLIDLCQEKFDAIVMNPPFGEPTELSRNYCEDNYSGYNKNILCAFLIRSFELLQDKGGVGVIFDRTAIVKNTYENFRRDFLLADNRLTALADLGWGVLDANVEVTSTVLTKGQTGEGQANFIDVRSTGVAEKGAALLSEITDFKGETNGSSILAFDPLSFLRLPNAVLGYDFPAFVVKLFVEKQSINETGVQVIAGHTILSDRYFRYWWEVPADRAFYPGADWQRLYNGGEYCRYISHLCDAVFYGERGTLISKNSSTIFRNLDRQGLGVLGFGKRGDFIDAHVLPANFVSSVEGQAVLLHKGIDRFSALAFFNSKFFQTIINLYCGQHKYPGYVHLLPAPNWKSDSMVEASNIAKEIYSLKLSFESSCETSPYFFNSQTVKFWGFEFFSIFDVAKIELRRLESTLDALVNDAYSLTEDQLRFIDQSTKTEPSTGGVIDSDPEIYWASNLIHFCLGCVVGRWDIKKVTCPDFQIQIENPFEALPIHPPASLITAKNGASRTLESTESPLKKTEIANILVNDQGNAKDITNSILEIFQSIHGSGFQEIEQRICSITKYRSLREYFSDPSGFFAVHLSGYSKGRREAPIYWPLSTVSGGYTIWLYYPSVSSQTLYSAINDFVDPKLKEVGRDVALLRSKGAGRSRSEEKQFEAAQALDLELSELRDTLLTLAPTYKPHQDDGVQITAAPLWSLIRHKPWQKVLKDTWAELENGKCDWAHLAFAYWPERVRRKCSKDKSMAETHGMERLYIEPEGTPKKTRGRKKSGGDE